MTCSYADSALPGEDSLLSRRQWIQLSAAGAMGVSLSSWLDPWAEAGPAESRRRRSCILLWMDGGPSQTDTFDLKPGHANGGPFREIATSVPGIKISEHLPRVASWMKRMAVIRSMNTGIADHKSGSYLMHTGYQAQGAIQYPTLGAIVSKELGRADAILPNYVSISPDTADDHEAHSPGFLGPTFAPLRLADNVIAQVRADILSTQASPTGPIFAIPNLTSPAMSRSRASQRLALLQQSDRDFAAHYAGQASDSHRSGYERALRLMHSDASKAFDLDTEPSKVRDAYGRTSFGQGCLLARRLVERGVPFVEVGFISPGKNCGGGGYSDTWDTHNDNFNCVSKFSRILDPAWFNLMRDLQDRGLLDTTLIVWMGEMGRTPQITRNGGRDHFASGWSTVLAGGGIRGGQVVGKTSADGMEIKDRPVSAGDFLATIYLALGLDPKKMNVSNIGRPISLAEENTQPIRELLA